MDSICVPGTHPEPRRKVKRQARGVKATPVEYKSHNRWLLIIVYATWLWILWNVLVFAYLGVRDRTLLRDLYPASFLSALTEVDVSAPGFLHAPDLAPDSGGVFLIPPHDAASDGNAWFPQGP